MLLVCLQMETLPVGYRVTECGVKILNLLSKNAVRWNSKQDLFKTIKVSWFSVSSVIYRYLVFAQFWMMLWRMEIGL